MAAQGKNPPRKRQPAKKALEAAISAEATLAEKAAEIRGDATELTPELFTRLRPLLREPIPPGFIVEVSKGDGKPYDSKGARSVQVLIDRMDNVLTPLWWWDVPTYTDGGKVCRVQVFVGSDRDKPLFSRESHGGMDRGSTLGNVYKSSYTNAAKLAFARVGPGHEIYVGAVDLDPDTNQAIADLQAQPSGQAPASKDEPIGLERGSKLLEQVKAYPGAFDHLEAKLRGFGCKTVGELTEAQGLKLIEWAQVVSLGEESQDG